MCGCMYPRCLIYLAFTNIHRLLDVVLQDFCEIVGLFDESTKVEHDRMYFRKLLPNGEEPVGNLGTCDAQFVDLPWESRASSCEYLKSSATTSSASTAKVGFGVAISGLLAMAVYLV